MTNLDIIRAWKDEAYRMSLSTEQRALLPRHPAGPIELTDAELDAASGGMPLWTCGCTILTPQGRCEI